MSDKATTGTRLTVDDAELEKTSNAAEGKMRPSDRYKDETEMLKGIVESHQAGMWSSLPTIIQKLDAKLNTVDVKSGIKLKRVKPDQSTEWVEIPQIDQLPVLFLGGGGVAHTFPLKKGDGALTVFGSRSIDKWWDQGGTQEQTEARMHDLSDGFVIPGFRPKPQALKNVSPDAYQLRTDDGKTHFTMDPRSGGAISMVSTANPTTMSGKAWNINVESSELKAQQNIKLDTPYTNATGDMKVNGRMDASGGFFKNGIPLGGGGSGGGGSGTVISVEAGTGLVGSGTTTEIILSLIVPVAIAHGGTGATSASQALINLGGAPINAPVFTGDPRVPTPPGGDADTSIANTGWVNTYFLKLTGGTISGNLAVTGTLNITGATTLAGLTAGATALSSLNVPGNTTLAVSTATTPAPADNSSRIATTAWVRNYVSPIAVVSTNDTSPASPTDGMMWWDSVSGQLYVYYTDANSSAWIQANTGAGFSVGSGGPFLPLSGGTLVGQLQLVFDDAPGHQLFVSGTTHAARIRTDVISAYVEGVDITNSVWGPLSLGGSLVSIHNSGVEVGRFSGGNFDVTGNINSTVNVSAATISSSSNASIGGSLYVYITGAPDASTTYATFSSRRIRFRQNSGDQSDAGAIDYRGYDGGALSLVGAGATSGSRLVRIFDNLTVDGSLTIGTSFTAANITAKTINVSGDPNGWFTFVQRDNYGISHALYATGNQTRIWNNQYGDRLSIDLGGTVYFTNNVVIPNNCWYYVRATDGIPYPMFGTDNVNRTYVGHPSFYTNIRGIAPIIFETSTRSYGDITADGRVITPRLDIYGGVFYNGYNNGWLYFNGSLRVADFYSENNVAMGGRLNLPNGHYLQYWNGYTDTGQPFHSGSNIVAEGSLTANNGVVYLAGMYWQNNGGWMFCPWRTRTDGDLQAGGDVNAGGVIRAGGMYWQNDGGGFFWSPWSVRSGSNIKADNDHICWGGVYRSGNRKGGRFECPGWDYDWLSPFCYNGTLFCTPDYSGGPTYNNDDWWCDARLKTGIRNSEIDALGIIMATPVRAWEWTPEGARLNTAYHSNRENTIGLVAQELQKTIPLAVKDSAWDFTTLTLDWNYIQPYMFRAIQQLAELNAKLEARIAQLEARLDRLQ